MMIGTLARLAAIRPRMPAFELCVYDAIPSGTHGLGHFFQRQPVKPRVDLPDQLGDNDQGEVSIQDFWNQATFTASLFSGKNIYLESIPVELAGGRNSVLLRSSDDKLAVATLPAVVVGLFLKDQVEAIFAAPWVAGAGLLATGVFLSTTYATQRKAQGREPGFAQALWIGCAQALAILPGVSRSGSTIAVALAFGVAPLAAAEFSFLLGIIAIVGAALLELPDALGASAETMRPLLVGALAAAVSGLAALGLLVRLLRDRRFHWFAGYTWAAGLAFLAYLAVR